MAIVELVNFVANIEIMVDEITLVLTDEKYWSYTDSSDFDEKQTYLLNLMNTLDAYYCSLLQFEQHQYFNYEYGDAMAWLEHCYCLTLGPCDCAFVGYPEDRQMQHDVLRVRLDSYFPAK